MGQFSVKEKYFKFIIYLVVIVLVNIVGITLFFRADLTSDKIYSLSPASTDVVETLSEPLTIKVFFSKDLPAPHNNTARYLRDLLEEYAARGGKLFNYTFYNVTMEEGALTQKTDENRDLAKDYGIQPVQIRIMENDEVKFKKAYMGLVIIHGDLIEKIEAITSTDGLEFQLTTAIQKMNNKVSALLQLDERVNVTMYLSSSLNTIAPLIGLDNLPLLGKAVSDTIQQLNQKSLGILEFKQVDISRKPELDTLGKKFNLMALSWPAIPEKKIKAGHGAAGLVIDFKGNTTTLPLISVMELPIIGTTYQMVDPVALEEDLNAVVEKLIGINKDIGVLAGHGAHSLMPDRMAMMQGRPSQAMQVFNTLVSSRYSIKPIDLKDGAIPDGLNCLILPRPTQKFSAYELFQIDQALMKGTNIAFILDAFNEIMPQQGGMGMPPRYEPIDTGLEKLLTHYGVNIKKAYVLDKNAYSHQAPQNMGGGEQIIYFAPMLKEASINNTPHFMDNIKGLVAMQISPLELVTKNIDTTKVVATRLLSSSDESWLMEGMINLNPMFIRPPDAQEELTSYDLAYLLEGRFTSFFKGKTIPEREMGEKDIKEDNKDGDDQTFEGFTASHTFLETSKPAKVFVLPCSQMLQDNMLDPEGRSSNATFILNVIDHLNGEDKIAQLRSKQQTFNPIVQTSPFARAIIKAFNIIALPIFVILFGLGVLAKRTARKKKIANRFNV
ncbi:GldG family protein [Desulfobacula sp.]|uniref:GldG family protein n=1 Tax=Desulfobacula sp. TaxID=2593537 RepID=UPI0026177D08|nr:GldG family protein [Desulfobacula sp.]